MKLKLLLLLIISFLYSNQNYAQISVGRKKTGVFKDFRKGELKTIKNKTTVFVIDQLDINEFEKIIKENWTFNNYLIIEREVFENSKEKYYDEKYALWKLRGEHHRVDTGRLINDYVYVYLDYYYLTNIKKKDGKLKNSTYNGIAAVYLGLNSEAGWELIGTGKFGDLDKDTYNYRLGYLKNYIQVINDYLSTNWFSFCYDSSYDKRLIKKLKKATLYIPDYIKIKSQRGFKDIERENPEKLFKNYNYKYEFINDEELNKKILESNKDSEDFYYLTYIRVNGQKFISVVNGKTGDLLYKDYQTFSYSLKAKDIAKLNRRIKKG